MAGGGGGGSRGVGGASSSSSPFLDGKSLGGCGASWGFPGVGFFWGVLGPGRRGKAAFTCGFAGWGGEGGLRVC